MTEYKEFLNGKIKVAKRTGITVEPSRLHRNEVYNSDCNASMKKFRDHEFCLAIVDPPYGINAPNKSLGATKLGTKHYPSTATRLKGRLNSGGGKLKNRRLNTADIDWDNEIPTEDYFKELFRISKNQIIWGGNYFPLPPTRCVVVWDKRQPWDNFSQVEIAWTSFDKPAKLFSYSNTGGANKEIKIHPTQKPVELYKYLIKTFGDGVNSIIDTHVGSGSSRIAAFDAGLDFVGFEINEDYFKSQQQRFLNYSMQRKMF